MSYFKAIWGMISNTVARAIRIDAATHAMTTIDYEHHEVHDGEHFDVHLYTTVANGADEDFLITVAATTKWPHMLWAFESNVEMEISLYEAVTTADDGTPYNIFNNDRNSGTGSGAVVWNGPTLAGGALGDAGQGGTLLWSSKMGAGKKIGGETRESHERILKRNTKYWFRVHNGSGGAGWLNFHFNWYEHQNKD